MITAIQLTLILLLFTASLIPTMGEAKAQKEDQLTLSINGDAVELTPSPVLKDGMWLVPLEPFSQRINAKVEYPEGSDMAVVCLEDRCIPLKLGDSAKGAIRIDGLVYAPPGAIVQPFGFQVQRPSQNRIEIVKGSVQMKNTENTAGQLAPDVVLPDLDGVPRHLSDFRGKKTLVYMWGSW